MRTVVASLIAVFLTFIPMKVASAIHINQNSNASIECMTKAMYHESRGESVEGIKAIGHVLINRSEQSQFPATICGVLYQSNQFSNIRHFKIDDRKRYEEIREIAKEVYLSPYSDNTNNATYFHSIHVHPHWKNMKITKQIGNHLFMKEI